MSNRRRSLNADAAYEQIQARAFQAWSHGRHTLIGGGKYDITLDDDAPIYALYRGGGLFNLSGLQPNQVNGQNFGLALVSYRYDLSGKGGLFPAYAGVSAEYGNAGAHHGDPFDNGIMNGSIFFGNRSPIGPLYWGFAFAEDDERAYFMRIGNVFGQSMAATRHCRSLTRHCRPLARAPLRRHVGARRSMPAAARAPDTAHTSTPPATLA